MEPDFKLITQIVSTSNEVPYEEVFKKTRKREVITAKFISIHFIRKRFPKKEVTLQRIGDFFGLGHSDIIHAIKTVKEKLEVKDEIYRTAVTRLNKKIYYQFKNRTNNFIECIKMAERMPQLGSKYKYDSL